MSGLTRAAMEEGGTSYQVFGNFPFPVAGKTGTAERVPSGPRPTRPGTSRSLRPTTPRSSVAVTIERGGFGVDSAAPVAARILEKYFQHPVTAGRRARRRPRTNEATEPHDDRMPCAERTG